MYVYGAICDIGDRRKENQDSILHLSGKLLDTDAGLFIVADGMGGMDKGAFASKSITDWFLSWWKEDLPQMLGAGFDSKEDIFELLEQEIWDINNFILDCSKRQNIRCGSTLSLLLLLGNAYYIENLGDSRIYLLRDKSISCLTEDQSVAAKMMREGQLNEAEALSSGLKNKLTMCMGIFEFPKSLRYFGKVEEGDTFIICSDGLYGRISSEDMALIAGEEGELQIKAQKLRQSIPKGSCDDNASVILVRNK